MTPRDLFFMRLRGILRKEVLQILRDPSSIALAIVLPLILLFIFGYGLSLDAENVPIAIVLKDNSSAARELAARFDLSPYFKTNHLKSMTEAMDLLNQRRVDGIVHVQSDFSSSLFSRNPSPVQVIVNGIDANRARLIQDTRAGYFRNGPPCVRPGASRWLFPP
jgi:ABC-2 type transport system permease protein